MKTCKLCWSISGILLLVSVAIAYKFIYAGSVTAASDGRQAIILNPDEQNMILGEMRMFLSSIQQISQALTKKDMKAVATTARKVGMGAQQAVPGSLMGKLPMAFKKLGFDTHTKFDQLALDAEQLGDPQHTLEQLSVLMNNCTGCHASYQIQSSLRK